MNRFITNLRQFKLITFDVTETLLNFRRPPGEEYANIIQKFGYQNVSEEISKQFRGHFKFMLETYPNFGCTSCGWENWWRMLITRIIIASKLNIPNDVTIKISDLIIDKYQTDECWVRVRRANELIEKLLNAGKTVGIISNFDPRLQCILIETKLPKFDFVLSSYECGVAKPNVKIFNLALEKCRNGKCMPKEALHIGNTPKLDYIGAINAGWCSALITNDDNEWKNYSGIKSEHIFRSISDLYDKLEKDNIQW